MTNLTSLRLNFSTDGGLPHADGLPSGKDGAGQLAYVQSIAKIVSRLNLVMYYFEYALRETKQVMQNPGTTHVTLMLSRTPRTDLDYGAHGNVKVIQLDLPYDPAKLLDIQNTAEALGEFTLTCWEQAIKRLEAETDFPAEFVRGQMARFREQGYTLENTLKPVSIVGSKAKARIHGQVSCASTVLKVEVAYRNKPLFERVIWDVPEQAFGTAYSKRECVVKDRHFRVFGSGWVGDRFLLPEVSFPLEDLPSEFLKTLTT